MAIGSIKIETGRTRDANLLLVQLYGDAGTLRGNQLHLTTHNVFKLAFSLKMPLKGLWRIFLQSRDLKVDRNGGLVVIISLFYIWQKKCT